MLQIQLKFIWLFVISFAVHNLLCQDKVQAASSCPKRTDYDSRCKKECTSNKNCRKRKNRVKKCLCDGVCGMSCIRIGTTCREETTLVKKLRRGFVYLNSKPYTLKKFNYGDEITYKCKPGFTLSGPSKMVCSGIGKWKPWDQGKPSCRKECENPGAPKDGRHYGDSYEVGKVVRFRCNPGYQRQGSFAITCMPNLQWNARPPKCTVLACERPKLPENARISRGQQFSYQYGDSVYFSCVAGYFRVGNPAAVCEQSGWKSRGSQFPTCAPKSCGSPGYVRNGHVEGTRYTFKSMVKFTCNEGYEMIRGNRYRRCLENQKWSGILPTCERNDCGNPVDVANGTRQSFGTLYKDKQYIDCNLGFDRKGPREITCESNGQWSHEPTCELVRCDSSYNSIDNGIAIGSQGGSICNNTYNCRIDFRCHAGYQLHSTDARLSICQANGVWSTKKPTCEAKNCGYPSVPKHGYLQRGSNDFHYPSVIKYGCNENYVLRGSSSRKCNEDGKWSDNYGTCIADCGYPGTPVNGIKIGSSYFGGDSVSFNCERGHDLIGEKSIQCQTSSATWSHHIPECRPKNCGPPKKLARGKLVGQPSFHFPSVIRYKCFLEYVMQGEPELTCEANGNWNRDAPSCVAFCADPGIPEHGSRIGDEFLANKELKFQCDIGYNLIGADSVTCRQVDARWSSVRPSCEIVECENPANKIANGFVNGIKRTYKEVISFGCNDGFILTGAEKLTCEADGRWSGQFPTCRGRPCEEPKNLLNGKIKDKAKDYAYPDVIEYICDHGFVMNGSAALKCELNGRWSQLSTVCNVVECENPANKIANGFVNGIKRTYKEVISFGCNDGFILTGAEKLTCEADGRWSGKFPTCREIMITCKKPQDIVNGYINTTKASFNQDAEYEQESEITYSCHNGFKLRGEETSRCDRNGWSGNIRICEVVDCGKPNVTNSLFEGDKTTYNNTIEISCKRGYERMGANQKSICQQNGIWSNLPECRVIDCGKPNVRNSVFDEKANTAYGRSMQIKCKEGFTRTGDSDIINCLENGFWSTLPECKEITCVMPSDVRVANGKIDSSKALLNKDELHKYKSKITYLCNQGFKLTGEVISECKENGWSGGIRSCTAVFGETCSQEKALGMENGDIKDQNIHMQTTVKTFEKAKGRLKGEEWCGTFKEYHGQVAVQIRFTSVVKVTSILIASKRPNYRITKVFFHYYDAKDSKEIFKKTKEYYVDLQKNDSYTVKLEHPATCSYFEIVILKNNGLSNFVCSQFEIYGCQEPSICGLPDMPVNGQALGMIYKGGNQALYSCNSGFKLENNEAQTCSANGTWIGTTPNCVKDNDYLGCYKDVRFPRILPTRRGNSFSPAECIRSCKNIYRINAAGLQYSSECFCGYESSLRQTKKTHDRECYIPCNKDLSRKCGGPWRNTVYRI